MAYRLTVSDRAALEIVEAYEWYQEQHPGLGFEFLEALDEQFQAIVQSPQLYAQIHRGVRRALLRRFPYGIFHALQGEIISVLAVVRTSRSPRRWPRH